MRLEGHYHVDVFLRDGQYLRGLLLQRVGETREYQVVDDCAVVSPAATTLTGPLPLEEALRLALERLRAHAGGPIAPAFGAAPFEVLGYERPGFFRATQEVGLDGRPGATRFRPGRR